MQERNWYAIQTRSRHEKQVARQMEWQGILTFLPLTTQLHRWSDRRKLVQVPLFPGYAFVHVPSAPEERLRVLRTEGVLRFVGTRGQGTPIPKAQIEDIKTVLSSNVPCASHPYLMVGKRVRIRGGSLDGVEGILVSQSEGRKLVISVEPIQRSLSIHIQGYDLERV